MGTTTVTTGPGQSHDSAGEPHTPGLSRRRALGLGGAAFAALPFLAACSAAAGGSGSSSGGGASKEYVNEYLSLQFYQEYLRNTEQIYAAPRDVVVLTAVS